MNKMTIHKEDIYASPTAYYMPIAARGTTGEGYFYVPDYVYIT